MTCYNNKVRYQGENVKQKVCRLNFWMLLIGALVYCVFLLCQRHFITGDVYISQIAWWDYIVTHGFQGIATLNDPVTAGGAGGDYTTIWYFLIWVFIKMGLYPTFSIAFNIKLMAVICCIVSAVTVYFIIRHARPHAKHAPIFGMMATLFLPAFFLDVMKTNLPDSVYLMFALLALLCFIKNKKAMAWFLLGFGMSFKLMAIYLAPFFIYFYLKDFKKYHLLDRLSPLFALLSIFICSIPNFLSGGSLAGGIIAPMTMRSADSIRMSNFSLWQLMPVDINASGYFSIALFMLLFFAAFFFIQYFIPEGRKKEVEYTVLLPLFPLLACYILPAQLGNYFALAPVFAFVIWCIRPKKETFFVFASTNLFLFLVYCLLSFRWFLPEGSYNTNSILYDNQFFSLLYAGIICFLGYQLFKNSVFYRKKQQSD